MEITKNLIVYKHNKFNRISNFNFGTQYKDNTGKLHQLKDVNGLNTTFVTNQASFILNKSIEGDMLTDSWLKNHPEIIAHWTRTDMQQKEELDTIHFVPLLMHLNRSPTTILLATNVIEAVASAKSVTAPASNTKPSNKPAITIS